MDFDKIQEAACADFSDHMADDIWAGLQEAFRQHLDECHQHCPVCVVDDDPPTRLSSTMEPYRPEKVTEPIIVTQNIVGTCDPLPTQDDPGLFSRCEVRVEEEPQEPNLDTVTAKLGSTPCDEIRVGDEVECIDNKTLEMELGLGEHFKVTAVEGYRIGIGRIAAHWDVKRFRKLPPEPESKKCDHLGCGLPLAGKE